MTLVFFGQIIPLEPALFGRNKTKHMNKYLWITGALVVGSLLGVVIGGHFGGGGPGQLS